ncbi:MAG: hypothetical protein FWG66_03905, partial [Spirochaetes bacterium]|nr:hypothetical protein [Spirochaetota bacterium]
RLLLVFAMLVIGVLILGTIYAFVRPPHSQPLFRIGREAVAESPPYTAAPGAAMAAEGSIFEPSGGVGVFSGIGRLRIPLANSSTMVISIAFPYPVDDVVFIEELALSVGDFRAIAADYFSSIPAESLPFLNEDAARAEILWRYNSSLRLGRIERLYFSELLIIE